MGARLRTLLVDDEQLSLDFLHAVLDDHPLIDIRGSCQSGAEAVERAADIEADLLFLDVEMPGMSGMEVAEAIGAGPMIIFATAHAEFAVDAFDADAVDYILKPFARERILSAVEKAALRRPHCAAGTGRALVAAPARTTLPVKDGGRTMLVQVDDILWAEGAGDYALLHTPTAAHTARVTLRDLERELEQLGFLRVHRSAIVRAKSVVSVTPLPKGEAVLTLTGGTEVKASRTHRAAIETLMAGL